ncbi:MAG TPA: squalene synthase HpnC [Acidimicrobiales bacterium]|jgi:squalene synthase HpnC|nr:squalene synthase HpnC [Acidimicrobiales bacterium]
MGMQIDARDSLRAKAHGENFPVASRILPRDLRENLLAVYAFARLTDDLGDEAEGDRLAQLNWLETELDRAAAGSATHPVLRDLAAVLPKLDVGVQPFRDLIEANRLDQRVSHYATYDDLVGYCMLSAAPVGRIVLSVFGASSPERTALSDQVCIGLQLVEHLQDLGEDAARGRVYMPADDMASVGCERAALLAASASAPVRQLVAREGARVRELLANGRPLAATLPFRLRVAVVGFAAGGLAALDALERSADVLAGGSRPSTVGLLRRTAAGLLATVRDRGRP